MALKLIFSMPSEEMKEQLERIRKDCKALSEALKETEGGVEPNDNESVAEQIKRINKESERFLTVLKEKREELKEE